MEELERLAGRLAHGFSQLDSQSPEGILETATLVSQLTDQLSAPRQEPAPANTRAVLDALAESKTALLVDPWPEDRGSVREMLASEGYTVLEAGSGAEAIELCAKHPGPIHLMLADVLMQDMSGREVAERAASLRTEMCVVYMSGYANDEVMFCGILGPGASTLQKPVTAEALSRKLNEVAEAQYA